MKALLALCLPVIVAGAMITGCNRNTSTGTTTVTTSVSVSYTGVPLPGQQLAFSTNARPGSTYLWSFGDGSPALAQAAPTHAYSASGSYNVGVTVNGNTDFIVRRVVVIFDDPIYTPAIAGTRTWHHKLRNVIGDSTYLGDTSFTITGINPVSVLIGNDTLLYSATDLNLLIFVRPTPFSSGIYQRFLGYDHVKDIIFYNKYSRDSFGRTNTEIFQWP